MEIPDEVLAPLAHADEGKVRREGGRVRETFEKCPHFVIPAKAEIQKILKSLDSYFRRNDEFPSFGRFSKVSQGS